MHTKEISRIDAFILKEIRPAVKGIKEIRGKHLRPILYLYTCRLLGTNPDLKTAAAIEMIHQASLLHDDVIDQSALRRLDKSFPSLHGNQTSILAGDYIYLKALLILGEKAAEVCLKMTMGELLQKEGDPDTLKIARLKTGSLFGLALGLCGRTQEQQRALRKLGEIIGLAFQLQDDLKDISEDKKNKILTYPLQHGAARTRAKIAALKKEALKQMKTLRIEDLANLLNRIIVG